VKEVDDFQAAKDNVAAKSTDLANALTDLHAKGEAAKAAIDKAEGDATDGAAKAAQTKPAGV
jgi:hypothetical protein